MAALTARYIKCAFVKSQSRDQHVLSFLEKDRVHLPPNLNLKTLASCCSEEITLLDILIN
jgi:hypothetical protein